MPRVSKLEPSNLTGEADPDITMESEKESKAKPITMKLPQMQNIEDNKRDVVGIGAEDFTTKLNQNNDQLSQQARLMNMSQDCL